MVFRDSGRARLLPSSILDRLARRLALPELCKVIKTDRSSNQSNVHAEVIPSHEQGDRNTTDELHASPREFTCNFTTYSMTKEALEASPAYQAAMADYHGRDLVRFMDRPEAGHGDDLGSDPAVAHGYVWLFRRK